MKLLNPTRGTLALAFALAWSGPTLAKKGHKAHEHGAAKLDVAVDGTNVSLALEMPGDDAFGFERAPKNDAEKAAIKEALTNLRKPDTLFRFPPDAGCTSKIASVKAAQEATLNGGKMPAGEHADVDADYTFACKKAPVGGSLTLGLLKVFPRLKSVRVQVVTGSTQSGQTIHSSDEAIKL
jgi:hypothetical protein